MVSAESSVVSAESSVVSAESSVVTFRQKSDISAKSAFLTLSLSP